MTVELKMTWVTDDIIDWTTIFWYVQNNHIEKKIFSQSDPVLIRQSSKKMQSDPVLNRPKLASILIQSDPVLSVLISGKPYWFDQVRLKAELG